MIWKGHYFIINGFKALNSTVISETDFNDVTGEYKASYDATIEYMDFILSVVRNSFYDQNVLINDEMNKASNLNKELDILKRDSLVNYYPYRHDIIKLNDIKEAKDQDKVTIECIVDSVPLAKRFRANMTSLTFRAMSNKKMIAVVIFNRAFLKPNLGIGTSVIVIGKYDRKKKYVNYWSKKNR